jgi:DNA-binding PadR family transcriptional regulator
MAKHATASKIIQPITSKRRTRPLGPFSYLLMCTLTGLPKEHCYGSVLEHHLSDQYGEMIDLAQVYVSLQRLVEKGFIVGTEQTAPTGFKHTVVVYTVTAKGREALTHAAHFYKMLAAAAPD